ncbi:hypothetical protein TPHA_0C00570 [Tetrapisispora phaffii CBS 4417]|uniref:DUF2415 domain-containing protein n=1 Tax=Tetrapisispora phaffii (strain ATCC 24235 / CBS 4417 / NBRC 1672 / NRRL Y-8282 / UCD 70-5) TaxID=1071381 RepID=G8BR38_TETPH|nr:hypothetical protein TPHA_0C00570 [Tetrapisispora phaffii CBS 4417]CCE62214.1 hypothetical protein TPHA_0C00570 [Tetrapisispora phaffii CBS 4417]
MTIENHKYHWNPTFRHRDLEKYKNKDEDYIDFYFNNTGYNKIYQNYLLPNIRLYDNKISINHWQLRDSIKASSNYKVNNNIYYIFDHSIRKINSKDTSFDTEDAEKDSFTKSSTVVNFNFKPRCFTEKQGLIACGGLIGPDDRGYPSNWNNSDRESLGVNHAGNGDDTAAEADIPCKPVEVLNDNVLNDNTNYSNPSLWKGIIQLHDTNTNISQSLVLGQFITNCVALLPISSNQYDMFSCNNDNHMYQCNINNSRVVLTKRYSDLKFALNYVALSNDSRTMVVSGDTNKFAIYRKNEFDNLFTLNYDTQPSWGNSTIIKNERIPRYALPDHTSKLDLEDMTASNNSSCANLSSNLNGRHIYEAPNSDHGFYTSFSNNDLQFATIFQNGVCLIYDTRNMYKPMIEINSTRPYSHSGSFRVCKYSNSIDDLLFITEHQSRIHVVDTRNFTNHQVISIPSKVETTSAGNIFSDDNSNPNASDLPNDVTTARTVPLDKLIPSIAPYPELCSKTTNEYNSLQEKGLYLINQDPPNYSNRDDNQIRDRNNINPDFIYDYYHNESEFDSSGIIMENGNTSRNRKIKSHHPGSDPYNFDFRLQRIRTNSYENNNWNNSPNSKTSSVNNTNQLLNDQNNNYPSMGSNNPTRDVYNASQLSGFPLSRRGGTSLWSAYTDDFTRDTITSYVTLESADESNICGLDCMQDSNGNDSLIVGYDYGLLQWNINSWARRSFSSYEFT